MINLSTRTDKSMYRPPEVAIGSSQLSVENRYKTDWFSVPVAPVEEFLLTGRKKVWLTDRHGKPVWGKRITVQSVLDSPIEGVWDRVIQPISLIYVAQGKINFVPVPLATLGKVWQQGQVYRFKRYLWGCIPVGFQTIRIEWIDKKRHMIQTREHGDPFIQIWDHLISLQPTIDGKTLYTDRIDLYAGSATPLVATWVINFCKHRQKRWWEVVKACIW